MSAPSWITRPAATWAFAGFLFLALAVIAVVKWRQPADRNLPRAAYLVASDGDVFVRLGLRTRRVGATLAVPADKAIALPSGKKLTVLHPDGSSEVLTGPQRIRFPATTSEFPTLAAPLSQLLLRRAIEPPAAGQPVPPTLLSPAGATRFVNPPVVWEDDPALTYDVAIGDPADPAAPPRLKRLAHSPVAFKELESTMPPELATDRLMGAIVRATDRPDIRAVSRFLVTPDATPAYLPKEPADLVREALEALTKSPARTGDAWLALSKLPPGWRRTELVVRLRLKTAADLGAVRAYDEAFNDLVALAGR
jgi:hypothetical protein